MSYFDSKQVYYEDGLWYVGKVSDKNERLVTFAFVDGISVYFPPVTANHLASSYGL